MTIVIGFYEQHALGAGQAIAYAFGPCHVGFTLYNRVVEWIQSVEIKKKQKNKNGERDFYEHFVIIDSGSNISPVSVRKFSPS